MGARFLPTFEQFLRWSFYTGGSAKKRVKRRIGADGDLHLSFANLAHQRNVQECIRNWVTLQAAQAVAEFGSFRSHLLEVDASDLAWLIRRAATCKLRSCLVIPAPGHNLYGCPARGGGAVLYLLRNTAASPTTVKGALISSATTTANKSKDGATIVREYVGGL